MTRFRRAGVSLAVVAMLGLPPASAAAYAATAPDAGDCIIVGPYYVEEVVDCAITIASMLVGVDPIEP